MRKSSCQLLLTTLIVLGTACVSGRDGYAQQLSSAEKAIHSAARSKYYDLSTRGFNSLNCSVRFDMATVPMMSAESDPAKSVLISRLEFTLMLDNRGRPTVGLRFPDGTSEVAKQAIAQVAGLMKAFISGVFDTWATKGLQGPIPPFDKQIESITETEQGFIFSLDVPGKPVQIFTDKSYSVTSIVSIEGKLKERPAYVTSPEGLIYAGVEAVDARDPANPVRVRYELGTQLVNGLQVPGTVRLRVNDNIDVKYRLDACVVQKQTVVQVGGL